MTELPEPSPEEAAAREAAEIAETPRKGVPATAALGLGILLLVGAVLAAWIMMRPNAAQEPSSPRPGRPHTGRLVPGSLRH